MTELRPDREAALDALVLALRERMPMDRETADRAFSEWDLQAAVAGGEVVGAVMTKGPELHAAVVPAHRRKWASRTLIRKAIAPLMWRFGFVKTSVMKDNPKGCDFVKRLGFEPSGEDANMIYFRMAA